MILSIRFNKRFQISVLFTIFLTLNTSCQSISKTTDATNNTNITHETTNSCAEMISQARNHRFKERVKEAIDEFQKAIKFGCNVIEIHRELAEMYHGLGNFDKTIEEYQLLLKIDNKDLRGHWALASVLILDKKDFENGIKEALLAQKMMDENDFFGRREIDRVLGKAYDGLGDSDSAKKHFSEFLKGCSETPDSKDCKEIKKRILEFKK